MTDVSVCLSVSLSVCVDVCRRLFFKSLSCSFFSDSYETWHTQFMCQYAKNCGTGFRHFDLIVHYTQVGDKLSALTPESGRIL